MAELELEEKTGNYSLYKVKDPALLPDTHILCAKSTRDVLYSPHVAGKPLQDMMEKNGELFATILSKKVLQKEKRQNTCELVFLSGGLFYYLSHGFKRAHSFAIPQCFIGIQRQRVEGREGDFRAISGYENFEALPDDANVIIGDTVATGSTLVKGVQLLLDAAEAKGTALRSINAITLAGSFAGAKKLAMLAKKHIAPQHPGCRVSFFACEALFHLMPDGTDLRFLMPGTIMPEESRKEAVSRYGECLGKSMKCAVFDWGTRCKNPVEHYKEFLKYCEEELSSQKLDAKAREVLSRMKRETQEELSEMQKPI